MILSSNSHPLRYQALERKLWGMSLLIAPAITIVGTLFWQQGEAGIIGGTCIILATIFWIPAFIGLFSLLRDEMPVYALLGLMIAIYGCIGGNNFGFEAYYREIFSISGEQKRQAFSAYPLAFNFVLFWPGPLFPLSLLVLSINYLRKKSVPLWVAVMLCMGAVLFPAGRIPKIMWIALTTDFILAIPLLYIGNMLLQKKLFNHSSSI
ncbi:MAG TPA: hypothetical protein VIN08_23980 [Ohtaekwangia sp.]|uniref:hypothetical protein n=1 Tax=Ohtaekwangia sp. TaxID=2066019 RepID=UPI002F94383A